jgi:branched-chain amino acid transport system ATP-binding protein
LLLEIEDARTGYGGLEVLHGISLTVDEGEIVTVLGPNGTGKTSLMRLLSGVLPLWSGKVRFAGAELGRLSPDKRARLGLCQLPEGRGIFQTLTVGRTSTWGWPPAGCPQRPPRPTATGCWGSSRSWPPARRVGVVAVRRPTADARSGPGADEQPEAAVDRRAVVRLAPRIVRDLFEVVRELREQASPS